MINKNYHTPVLLNESVDGLNIIEDGVYVDVTFGGGGHSKEILSRLGQKGRLIAFDQDKDSKMNLINDNRLLLINENFMYLKKFLKLNNILKVDGILADFGISSHQIDKPDRGFSYRFNSDLDMRMDNNNPLSASHILNKYSSEDLNKIFKEYGELNNSSKITRAIISSRNKKNIKTTLNLMILLLHLFQKGTLIKFYPEYIRP